MNTEQQDKDGSIQMAEISRSPSDGIVAGDGDCLSPAKIKEKIFEDIMRIDWGNLSNDYKVRISPDGKAEEIAKRLNEISIYIISIFDERKCTKSWKEYISYLNGFVAAVVFANVTTNQNNLFLKNGVTASGIMVYNGINFYVSSLASVKKHFEERYRHLDQLIDDAYISKSIYDKDPESGEISGTDDMVYIFKAIVIAMYSLEKQMKTKVERLNQRVFANYCADLFQATFLYITNKKKLLRASSDDSQEKPDFIDLSADLLHQIEAKNFERYFWKTLTQEDGKHSEIMLNTIARHYSGKSKYTHSSKDLFLYSYRIEDFESHSSDITVGFQQSRDACNNAFKLFVNAIESRKEIERNLFLLSSVIIISSVAYSMSFNNPFGIGLLLYNVLYSAFAFIAAQKIEEINSEKSEKYQAFIVSIRNVSHSLKSGRFLQNSEDKRSVTAFKPKWLYSADLSNSAASIKASPTLQDIHFIAALTFVKLGEKQLSQESINKMDMATCYMNINISLAKAYEQIAQPSFRFSESHASSISSALAILILDNIRGSQNHNFDPAAILRPITGVLLNVPNVSDMYQTIDKTIGLHDLQREQQHDSGQHGQENRHVMFIREMLKEKVLNSTSKFSPSKNQMKHRRAVTPIITDNTGSDTSPDSVKIEMSGQDSWVDIVMHTKTPSSQGIRV